MTETVKRERLLGMLAAAEERMAETRATYEREREVQKKSWEKLRKASDVHEAAVHRVEEIKRELAMALGIEVAS